MAERLVASQLSDLPVFNRIRREEPRLAAGMFQYFIST